MTRYKKEERDRIFNDTRQVLLEAAAQEFARQGYIGANINHISLAAGFAKGTIYNYFESKRALMLALIDEVAVTHFEFIADQVSQESNAVRRLERFFEAGFDWVTNHLAHTKGDIYYFEWSRNRIQTIYVPSLPIMDPIIRTAKRAELR